MRIPYFLIILILFGGCLDGDKEPNQKCEEGSFWCDRLNECIDNSVKCSNDEPDPDKIKAVNSAVEYLKKLNIYKTDGQFYVMNVLPTRCNGCYTVELIYGNFLKNISVNVILSDFSVIGFHPKNQLKNIVSYEVCNGLNGKIISKDQRRYCDLDESMIGEILTPDNPSICCVRNEKIVDKLISDNLLICAEINFTCEPHEEKFYEFEGCGCRTRSVTGGKETRNYCSDADRGIECQTDLNIVCGWYDLSMFYCSEQPCGKNFDNPCLACQNTTIAFWTEKRCPKALNDTGEEPGNFVECMKEGFQIIEGQPRICKTESGLIFEEITCEFEGGLEVIGGSRRGITKYCLYRDIESFCFIEEITVGKCKKGDKFYVCDKTNTTDEGFYDKASGELISWAKCATQQGDGVVIGGRRDEYGCIPAAGYHWCESKKKCIRFWEESCI